MINIRSIRCSVAFGPYLLESLTAAIQGGAVASRVVRQGGRGLIIRADSGLVLRHELRQDSLDQEDLRHYLAAIKFRTNYFDVLRMPDEVVLSTIGEELILSHPQSEMWLKAPDLRALLALSLRAQENESEASLPEWLEVSTGGDRLLLSDQRTGRWVLLGQDHIAELGRRLELLRPFQVKGRTAAIPTINVKGLEVHLQSATSLANALDEFATTGTLSGYEEITPVYSLVVRLSAQGIELSDSDFRIWLSAREARKWASILRAELQRLRVQQVERNRIRTVFADCDDGYWILQWGDRVLVPKHAMVDGTDTVALNGQELDCIAQPDGEFLLLLDPRNGACVALTDLELSCLKDLSNQP